MGKLGERDRVDARVTPETKSAPEPTRVGAAPGSLRRGRRDLAIAIVASVAFFCLASAFDFYEQLQRLFQRTELYELDELFLMLPFTDPSAGLDDLAAVAGHAGERSPLS